MSNVPWGQAHPPVRTPRPQGHSAPVVSSSCGLAWIPREHTLADVPVAEGWGPHKAEAQEGALLGAIGDGLSHRTHAPWQGPDPYTALSPFLEPHLDDEERAYFEQSLGQVAQR